MVDRGIEVILNSTIWTNETHSGAYDYMKERLGLDPDDPQDIGMIINTSMSPWLRAQRTYKRLGIIIRNELYNAHGAVYDEVSSNQTEVELESFCPAHNPELCLSLPGRNGQERLRHSLERICLR